MFTIRPVVFETTKCQIAPQFDILDIRCLFVFLFSSCFCHRSKLTIMPEMTPTPWMLENHADKGKEPW